jgi:hypothetical protein
MLGGAQIHVAVVPGKLEQEPDLFLTSVVPTGIASDVVVRHFIAQPIARPGNDSDMIGQ